MHELAAAFIEARRRILGPRVERTTITAYRRDLARFLDDFGGYDPAAITPAMIETYLRELRRPDGAPVAPATANRHHATLSAFFGWLEDQGTVERNPARKVKKSRVPESPPGALPPEVCDGILAGARKLGARDHALIAMMLATGLRISEALSLNVEDVDLGGLYADVKAGKGGKGRRVFFTPTERKILRRLLVEHPEPRRHNPLFMSSRGQRLSYARAASMFRGITKDIKNPDGSPLHLHQLRHSFATSQLAKGMNPVHLLTVTGHSDLRMLNRYTKASRTLASEAEYRKHNQ